MKDHCTKHGWYSKPKTDCPKCAEESNSALSDGLFADLEDVKRLIESDTLIAACKCYSDKTNGSTAAHFALDKVRLRVQGIIDKISR